MERRLAEIPTEEWGDVQVDITPREYVLDYLAHQLPDPALRALHRQRGQSVVAPGLSETASRCNAGTPSRAATA